MPIIASSDTSACLAGANNKITRVTCQRCGDILRAAELDGNAGYGENTIVSKDETHKNGNE